MARLDLDLVRRGLVRSRSEASELISQGRVRVGGVVAEKAATQVDESTELEITGGDRYVGRGGFKLAFALDHFAIDVAGEICLDVGSSTGGFTDCLLQRGATRVVAVDVGADQLDQSLRNDPRVELRERTDIRHLDAGEFEAPFSLVVVDVAFISVCDIAPVLARLTNHQSLVLIKPQYEVGKERIGRGVVIRERDRSLAVEKAQDCLGTVGLDTVGVVDSPLPGEHGNREVWLLVNR
jgi:23S rRNA (cytidine1920-2'-O)/16S rRNA (cytidine1409-2'-O)-methyltransferase